jgi:hypothetical protein
MPEGLNPIEAGKQLHEHGEAASEQAEKTGGHGEPADFGGADRAAARTSELIEVAIDGAAGAKR